MTRIGCLYGEDGSESRGPDGVDHPLWDERSGLIHDQLIGPCFKKIGEVPDELVAVERVFPMSYGNQQDQADLI